MCCNEGHGHHHDRRHGGHCDCGGGHHGERSHNDCQGHHGGHECGCGDRHGQGCCCEQEHRHDREHCCCKGDQGRHFRRHFHTHEERLAWLGTYLKDLQAEVKAVEEQMAELKAAQ